MIRKYLNKIFFSFNYIPRKPSQWRRPSEYFYDEEDYEDDYVEERPTRRRNRNRNKNRRPEYDEYDNPPRSNYKDDEEDYSFEQQRPAHRLARFNNNNFYIKFKL